VRKRVGLDLGLVALGAALGVGGAVREYRYRAKPGPVACAGRLLQPPGRLAEQLLLPLRRPGVPPEPPWTEQDDALAPTLEAQRQALLRNLRVRLGVSEVAVTRVQQIIAKSAWLGQGNPEATEHQMTRAECRTIRKRAGLRPQQSEICGAKNMVPLYARSRGQTEADAEVCIDQFEFPNIACDYPVTWVQAKEAAELCQAIGKRLCDAHEWEGACAGDLRPANEEYAWGERRVQMQYLHNQNREIVWAYGKTKNHAKCATGSHKSRTCTVIGWHECGSNTYPAGAFPECVSPFGVYDQHGNAAEHMNLPLQPEQLASAGGMGETEMKGSWFIFASYEAHLDDCRWRAPNWHGTRVLDRNSHRNYHLGFRCCKDIEPPDSRQPSAADGGE
jgi:sulfatase modifying factor 1